MTIYPLYSNAKTLGWVISGQQVFFPSNLGGQDIFFLSLILCRIYFFLSSFLCRIFFSQKSVVFTFAYGKPSRGLRLVSLFYLFNFFFVFVFFSVSVKVLPVTPLVSGVFVHRAFCAYFLRIERVVELRRFLWWTQ